MDLTKADFDSWLVRQRADRQFDYTEPEACLIASFMRECGYPKAEVNPTHYRLGPYSDLSSDHRMPPWMKHIGDVACSHCEQWFTVADFRTAYALHPQPNERQEIEENLFWKKI